ncbi:hypothetical protein LMH87_000803 [Akanthomyces muscarius]|uniref:Parasitic phase-specific protein PSP-1 n=1 Tax=Akanthomyces muscarius TaxID=2231603 RepID=A0A9W8QI25_AKAMU|nr:hypothetical protein LMH87_000803 [Akanthomyces muscarius]KAJ4155565.1 hypothetical protein LMH87_000803 [Akanthomyces muscarius]
MPQGPPNGSSAPHGIPPGTIVFGPKGNCTLAICPVQYSVYGYRPSLAANSVFIALFAAAGAIHLYQGIRWKSWLFMCSVLIGCVSAILGYIGRVMMHTNPFNFSAFMLQIICVTTTPIYFCAAIYVTLAQVITTFSPALSRFKPSYFYWIFVPCDFVSLVIQAAGGALSVASKGTSQIGVDLALSGLSFQVFTICIFCGFMGEYMYRYFRSGVGKGMYSWKLYTFFTFLSLAILLITIRCVFRVVELRQGYRGSLVREETLFIALEGVLVLASAFALMLGHPGLVFKEHINGHQEIQRDSVTFPLADRQRRNPEVD